MSLEIALVFLLILCNGFFALSEMSVVTSRKPRLKKMAQESRRAQKALELAEQHDFIIASDECYADLFDDEAAPPPSLLTAAAAMASTAVPQPMSATRAGAKP